MTRSRTIRSLSFHAEYACRKSGACCTANWPIPVEADRLSHLRAALASGRLRPTHDRSTAVQATRLLPTEALTAESACFENTVSGDVLVRRLHDACVFFDARHGRVCRIHASLGHDALPLACRQFPRVSLIDPRGVSVTLSHYCPTAAGLLTSMTTSEPISIVESPSAFPRDQEYVGLDAETSLPPLLKPNLLMDWESWWEWERRSVRLLLEHGDSAGGALDALAGTVETVRQWTPSDQSLGDAIDVAFREGVTRPRTGRPSEHALLQSVQSSVPEELQRPLTADTTMPEDTVVRRFLAAHAFANWTAHLGQGLRTWLRSLDTAYALLEVGTGVRQADLYLRHLADPYALANRWSDQEHR